MVDQQWRESDGYPARLAENLDDGVVRCHLSPRHCRIRPGQHGFCMVRANRDGRLVSLNYGRSVHATEETIETEAVFHYSPGERILSMGNIGCMLNCDYCHNWKTSQARFVADGDIYHYTPEQVVDIAVRHGIRVLSWTYNDPVVWHEFVTETAELAREAGLINLFKSAFFISPEAVDELIPVIDIFSISIKSMNPVYYRKLTKGWIEPVLEGCEQVYRAGRHVEVSTLMVTDLSDDEETARAVATFVGEKLDPTVPLHFVRFHPDYKMTSTTRTPIPRLEAARRVALGMGIEQVYLGNVYDHDATRTHCRGCGALLVDRFGLVAKTTGLDADRHCVACGRDAHVKLLEPSGITAETTATLPDAARHRTAQLLWHGDIRSSHVQVRNGTGTATAAYYRKLHTGEEQGPWKRLFLQPAESYRFAAAQGAPGERGIEVAIPAGFESSLHEVFDRAHFPTVSAQEAPAVGDVTPFPLFQGTERRVQLPLTAVSRPSPVPAPPPAG
jgi:pyruvate formate lyase activating enzyme